MPKGLANLVDMTLVGNRHGVPVVERPSGRIHHLARRTGLSAPTVAAGLRLLEEFHIVNDVTGRRRGIVFTYDRYLTVLREGTEDPPG